MKKLILRTISALIAIMMIMTFASCANNNQQNGTEEGGNAKKTFKVGIIQFVDDASLKQIEENIQKRLDEKGKELGVEFNYKDHTYNGQADATTINQIAAQLIADNVDVIIPIATPTAQIVQSATEENQIPVVFSAVSDPETAKLVDSLAKPGHNITGTSDALNSEAIFNLMMVTKPDMKKVGLLYSKSEDASTKPVAEAKEFFAAKNIEVIEKTGTNNGDVIAAADALVSEKVDAVFTPTDNTIMTAELSIYEKFLDAGIPHFAGADSFALNGAFCGYGVDYTVLGQATADMVIDILVNGKKPADMQVMTFDNGIASVNTESCEKLGYDLADIKDKFTPYTTAIVELTTKEYFD